MLVRKRLGISVLTSQPERSNEYIERLVPFEEDDKDPSVWFLDHNYVESMNDMFKKVNAREKLIGWYHSGPKLRASDLEINELFKRYSPNPLLVIIDVQPKESGVPTDAYFAVDEIKDVRQSPIFRQLVLCNSSSPMWPRLSLRCDSKNGSHAYETKKYPLSSHCSG